MGINAHADFSMQLNANRCLSPNVSNANEQIEVLIMNL